MLDPSVPCLTTTSIFVHGCDDNLMCQMAFRLFHKKKENIGHKMRKFSQILISLWLNEILSTFFSPI